jgi:hypothetical protein
MQTAKRTIYTLLFVVISQVTVLAQPDQFFCNALQAIIEDANNNFGEQTNRDRLYLLNTLNEDRFDATLGLPVFMFEKVISRGIEGLYYEAMLPNIPDSATLHLFLKDVDYHLLSCANGLVRNPRADSLHYTYHYQRGDTLEEIFIRMWGTYPTIDADSFFSAGQINLEIYGDERRTFLPYKLNPQQADPVLKAELQKIEKGLLDNISLIQGAATKDFYKNTIYKTKVPITGSGNAFVKPYPENLNAEYGYYAEFYAGPSLADAQKAFKKWDTKIKNNAFTDKRFTTPNRKRLQWVFLPYNELFDPTDYSNIVEQSGYSCPLYSEEPLNRTPIFAYHLFLMEYADDYIVGLSIGNRF